ncbi:hypothetical protein GWI33_010379 [Rhynchophorus ferrugineus]|uniref:Uncharacterized protein n=1 Tax=Rhynchophorus ferrugineus TaxID=354439 RepID=A0A834ICA3_RHYFE|nr:hypothetical protein GWI33_010379 [Rhynchophorus ferrugineus]
MRENETRYACVRVCMGAEGRRRVAAAGGREEQVDTGQASACYSFLFSSSAATEGTGKQMEIDPLGRYTI